MRAKDIDQRILELAARQLWLFNRAQACALGASGRHIGRRVASGAWTHPEPSVFGLAGHRMTWRRGLKASELGTPDAAVGGMAAAALHGLPDFRPGRPELVAPPCTSSRGKLATVHRQAGFKTTVVDGITVTTVAQTLFDVAPRVSVWRLERGMDDSLVSGALSVPDRQERLRFYEGSRRHGLGRIRPLIIERGADGWVPPESDLEARLFRVLDLLPFGCNIVRQPSWPWRTGSSGRVDAYLPDFRLIIEADGRRWHTRVRDFDADRWRDNQAVANGLRVLRFTWTHLTATHHDVLELITQTIRARAAA